MTATAGFSEELFFRGILFNSIESFTTFPIALVLSSVIFGLVHFPLWGANAIIETVLGGVLCYAYWVSGSNLAVPIAIHTMYDFLTLFFTWYSCRNDLQRRMELLTSDVQRARDYTDYEIDKLAEAVRYSNDR